MAQHGTNYAGHYAIAEISCGMQCTTTMVIDGQTGRIVDFPLGGQDYRNLDLTYRPDSSLVKAEWETDDVDMCGHAQFVFDGTVFHRLPGDSQPSRCSTS